MLHHFTKPVFMSLTSPYNLDPEAWAALYTDAGEAHCIIEPAGDGQSHLYMDVVAILEIHDRITHTRFVYRDSNGHRRTVRVTEDRGEIWKAAISAASNLWGSNCK